MDFELKPGPWTQPGLKTLMFRHACYTKETVGPSALLRPTALVKHEESLINQTGHFEPLDRLKTFITIKSEKEFYDTFVGRTSEQCALEAVAPQRSAEWLEARRLCITASSFGAATGSNPYCSQRQLVLEKLWTTFGGNDFTRYGSFHEQDAEDALMVYLRSSDYIQQAYCEHFNVKTDTEHVVSQLDFTIKHFGLLKSHAEPWLAVSPDGVLCITGLLGPLYILVEYKCPAGQRHAKGHPYERHPNCVPKYYMEQMQGIMGLLRGHPELIGQKSLQEPESHLALPECLFVVWQPDKAYITRVPFDAQHYSEMHTKLKTWYFDLFLPAAYKKYLGHLVPNTLETVLNLDLLV